ncbi:tRNA (guanosine(37)-N1)-methyltransferase TrmD [Geoalkalibacter halelectricus]|uniref:tRNA (guanine-N(1)-)-methyltransferase n=1 Tax=Geoalkalibacter halelectricus TaxID=2847045 RepID=A0ABY5ZMM2_9BACT|nr:tRNA (guanosine(37)-N1)-methyltransferase TrmD [Geoalkalibacter halelectricus]MDO3378811.1 tRNA (guanosine(37)-N1)-methyltransferase TrmD [Geoalkalibacter halelectricus]UWZ79883.1 tRNA (guanosine(37)-N1)-methyltransferase TrmD [Geoalkalibacter halelectricus]
MTFDILTLFPAMFASPMSESILGKAVDRGLISVHAHNLRDWAAGRHQVTDDAPYGGGDGMVMKVEPVVGALRDLRAAAPGAQTVLLTPQGRTFTQREAAHLAKQSGLIFVCGRYEGYDERIRAFVDVEYSIGDFILTGGELAAMVMIDAIARLIPGVLGCEGSAAGDSFSDGLLEYPQYTRPAEFEGLKVPEVLLSGNHGAIARWRRQAQLERTARRRPDLLADAPLSDEDRRYLAELAAGKDGG